MPDSSPPDLLFKALTPDNWRQKDDTHDVLPLPDGRGGIRPLAPDDYAQQFLAVTLSDRVPIEIRRLFDVAKGTACYGWYFYPLYALSAGEAYRAADAALAARVKAEGGSHEWPFRKRIDWLGKRLAWPPHLTARWHTLRELRNQTSHPKDQSIWLPGLTVNLLRQVAYMISEACRLPDDPPTPEPAEWNYHTIRAWR